MNMSAFKLRYVLLNMLLSLPLYIFVYFTLSLTIPSNPAISFLIGFMYIKNIFYESKMDYLDDKITQLENKINS